MASRVLFCVMVFLGIISSGWSDVGYERPISSRSFGTYTPKVISSLAELPDRINHAVKELLVDRVGLAFYSKLSFVSGFEVDLDKLIKSDPSWAGVKWPIAKYYLAFKFQSPESGIESYAFTVELSEKGGSINEIELPAVERDVKYSKFVPLNTVRNVVTKEGLDLDKISIELGYSRTSQQIVWIVSQETFHFLGRGFVRVLIVSAHDGSVLVKTHRWRYN